MIYILDQDLSKSAQMLDDTSLEKQIKDIADVLCWSHENRDTLRDQYLNSTIFVELPKSKYIDQWWQWARECKANYMWLVKYGKHCSAELMKRLSMGGCKTSLKYMDAIDWARDNVPDLPEAQNYGYIGSFNITELPLIIPKKYYIIPNKIDIDLKASYRNYYQAKLKQKIERFENSNRAEHYRIAGVPCRYEFYWTNRQRPEWIKL